MIHLLVRTTDSPAGQRIMYGEEGLPTDSCAGQRIMYSLDLMLHPYTFSTILSVWKNLRGLRFGVLVTVLMMGTLSLRAQMEEDQWTRSQAAGGRIRVVAKDAALMQMVSVWAARSLTELEREWGLSIPFQADHPLILMGSGRAEEVTLQQDFRQGVLRQRILMPEAMQAADSRELARIFTRALAVRVMMAAQTAEEKSSGVQVPAWLELGSAIRLMGDRQREVFRELMASEPTSSFAYPEEIAGRDRKPISPVAEAEAGLLCRWLFGREGITQTQKRKMWAFFAAGEILDVATLMRLSGRSRDLRELHQHWDLWWQQERLKLMAEFRMTEPVLNELRKELRFLPGFYGLYREDLDRTRYLRFEQLEDYLDDPAFATAMATWSLRLQTLRFRQPEEVNNLIASFQQAISTLAAASREKGKTREKLWTQAVSQWHQALGVLRDVGLRKY